MTLVAATFHFPASEIMEMDATDIAFWTARADEWYEAMKKGNA